MFIITDEQEEKEEEYEAAKKRGECSSYGDYLTMQESRASKSSAPSTTSPATGAESSVASVGTRQ
jgi:hypothetical protein